MRIRLLSCIALNLLLGSSQLHAQSVLESATMYNVPFYGDVDVFFDYVGNDLVTIRKVASLDSSLLEISYEQGFIDNIFSTSNTNAEDNFSLNFKNNGIYYDTVFFTSASWIGKFVLSYDEFNLLDTVHKYVVDQGEYKLLNRYQYTRDVSGKTKYEEYQFNLENEEDWSRNTAKYTRAFNNGNTTSVYFTQSESHGHREDTYHYYDNILEERSTIFYNGGDEIVSQSLYTPLYAVDKTWDDIRNPWNVMNTLADLKFQNAMVSLDLDFLEYHHILDHINKNNDPFITFHYDQEVITELESEEDETILYPNPVRDYLHFRPDYKVREISIHDIQGRLACRMNYEEETINLRNLEPGNYILSAMDQRGEPIVMQFVKL